MKKTTLLLCSLLVLCFLYAACNKDDDNAPQEPEFNLEQTFPIQYVAEQPDSLLPWPHHDPSISQSAYEKMLDELFIINNYGQYQCGEEKEECYFHDGLDVVLNNGTPVFAVEPGTVKAELGGNEYYRTLVVEDADEPGMAWAYTHIYYFAVGYGDELEQGQYLGRVNFQGVEHIHLSRVRLADGGSWFNYSDLIHVYPDRVFVSEDNTPPTIETPFQFYKNTTDELMDHGMVDTVSGDVDIVVRMRDTGSYSKGDVGGGSIWGDRLCVKRIEYSIQKDGVELLARPSFDFSKMEFQYNPERWREAGVVYKFHYVADPDHQNFNGFLSNYIITNARDDLAGQIDLDDTNLAWNTAKTNDIGERVFPDGLYKIVVKAWDAHDNMSMEEDEVYVKND